MMKSIDTMVLLLVAIVTYALPTRAADGVSLFNGKNLDGWQGMGGEATNWTVKDRTLTCTGAKGAQWLATTTVYADFDLTLSFRLPANGNSGVFIRAPREGNPWVTGLEIQLLDDYGDKWKDLKPAQFTGSIYAVQAPSKRATKPAPEWQTMRVLCVGRTCRVWVGDQQVIDADLDELAKEHGERVPGLLRNSGLIGLQNHGDPVAFRDIRLREVSAKEAGAEPIDPTPRGPAVTPQPRIVDWWFARHAEQIGAMSKGEFDLLMVGDSITHNFESVGAPVWKKYFEPRKAINLGFGGDRTNHVLWRLDHLPKLKKSPRGAVVLIGTNNICWGSDTPKQAAHGVRAVARKLGEMYPEMETLVLGVFPRRRKIDHPHRKEIDELNSYLPALLKDLPKVTFLDIGKEFLDDKGFLSEEMMPDTTHPSEKGHEIWARAIEAELKKMLNES